MKRNLKVMLLVHPQMRPDRPKASGPTEKDVWRTLKKMGCRVGVTPLRDDLRRFDRDLAEQRPDVVFNLLEEFRDEGVYDFHAVTYLESVGIAYTGCNPRGLIVSRNKAWATQIALGIGIEAPATFPRTGSVRYPAFVKYVREHASRGLTQKSRVRDAGELQKTVAGMLKKYPGEIAIQEFVPGEDVTVSVYGNARPVALPPWRLSMGHADAFATERVKFNPETRRRRGIRAYRYVGPEAGALMTRAKKLYAAFDLSGYARLDFRLTPEGRAYFIDVNANPNLAHDEDFARAAGHSGLKFPDLLKKILTLARDYKPRV